MYCNARSGEQQHRCSTYCDLRITGDLIGQQADHKVALMLGNEGREKGHQNGCDYLCPDECGKDLDRPFLEIVNGKTDHQSEQE